MEMTKYQKQVIKDFIRYLELLNEKQDMSKAYTALWNEKNVCVGFEGLNPYNNIIPHVPHVCFKVPTGGGKTFIACNAIKNLFDVLNFNKPKVVVWLVPSDSILEQTTKALSNSDHPYRQKINADFNSRVEVLTKQQALNGQGFKPDTVAEQLIILVLSYDSFRGRSKEALKAFRENSNLAPFTKAFDSSNSSIENADETSLIQTINNLSPFVIVDESHHAQSDLSIEMLKNFNPCFVLDLTATPKKNSNIISYVDAAQLKKENMVKLPVIVYNRKSQDDVVFDAITLRNKLEIKAQTEQQNGGRYIRPIVLFQAQSKGSDDNTTFEKLKKHLIDAGIPKEKIAIKTADINELKNEDLLSAECKICYIITVNAFKEGWDCPFAYILATIANRNSAVDVEQILGRILRQPHTMQHTEKVLNMSYVLTCSNDFHLTVSKVIRGLQNAGFSDKDYSLGNYEEKMLQSETEPTVTYQQLDLNSVVFEKENEDLSFNPQLLGERIAQVIPSSEVSNDTIEEMLTVAIEQSDAYTIENNINSEEAGVALEVRCSMSKYELCEEFKASVHGLKLPQFFIITPQLSFFEGEGGSKALLSDKHLAKDFTLKDKDIQISFDSNDGDIAKVDIQRNKNSPTYSKLTGFDNEYFKELFNSQPPEKKVSLCKGIIHKTLSKMDEISDNELKGYVERIIDNMTSEQLSMLETSAPDYAQKIKNKVQSLLNIHNEQQFSKWLDTGKIVCEPSYLLPKFISPLSSVSMIANSLYTSEPDDGMNTFEKDVILRVAALPNILWWHRNISRTGFVINGFINHYPDFIVMTKTGKVILIETKGDDRDNSDSVKKAKLGRIWHNRTDNKFQYYMVFQSKDLNVDGCYCVDKFLELIKEL